MKQLGNLLTVDEVATRLRVSRTWISRRRTEGAFAPELHLGARVLFDENELKAWLERQTKQPTAA